MYMTLFITVIVLLLLYVIVTYNGLIMKRNMVKNMYSSIDVYLKKRADLVPNLVETVTAYASYESDTITKVMELRSRSERCNSSVQRILHEDELTPALQQLIALEENYPDLKADAQFINLQRNLSEIEEQLSAVRRAYNAAVVAQNNAIETFPSNIIASMFNFEGYDFFSIESDDRESPNIQI